MEGSTRGDRRGIGSLLEKYEEAAAVVEEDGDASLSPALGFMVAGLSCRGRGARR